MSFFQIDPDLVLPTMRSSVEEQLMLIAQGKANFHDIKQHALDIFHLKFRYFVQHISAMDELFEVTFTSLADSGRPLSRLVKFHQLRVLLCLRWLLPPWLTPVGPSTGLSPSIGCVFCSVWGDFYLPGWLRSAPLQVCLLPSAVCFALFEVTFTSLADSGRPLYRFVSFHQLCVLLCLRWPLPPWLTLVGPSTGLSPSIGCVFCSVWGDLYLPGWLRSAPLQVCLLPSAVCFALRWPLPPWLTPVGPSTGLSPSIGCVFCSVWGELYLPVWLCSAPLQVCLLPSAVCFALFEVTFTSLADSVGPSPGLSPSISCVFCSVWVDFYLPGWLRSAPLQVCLLPSAVCFALFDVTFTSLADSGRPLSRFVSFHQLCVLLCLRWRLPPFLIGSGQTPRTLSPSIGCVYRPVCCYCCEDRGWWIVNWSSYVGIGPLILLCRYWSFGLVM